jgi:hypothetical protein
MNRMQRVVLGTMSLALLSWGATASADPAFGGSPLSNPEFTPRVPISQLARPLTWIDPSRFHVSTSVSVGSGFGGGTNALQVTRLSYQFASPLSMSVSVGNAWGPASVSSGRSFFLEGMDVAYRPFQSMQIQVHYRDLRSPLQLSPYSGYGGWGP